MEATVFFVELRWDAVEYRFDPNLVSTISILRDVEAILLQDVPLN